MKHKVIPNVGSMIKTQRTFSSLSGILLLDKPVGITSNGALQQVKRLLKAKKAGHTGSLDPLASGMLPICVGGEATKFSSYLLDADKQYEFCVQLGICTTTGDAEGEITARNPVPEYSLEKIESVLRTFLGEIEQIPPMFSAIKQNGRPLYELARQGITVEREKRKVHIKKLQLIDKQPEQLTLAVHCSKGTYIRTLAEDIGEILGCGAYVTALRRTAVGSYLSTQMISLADLENLVQSNDQAGLVQSSDPVNFVQSGDQATLERFILPIYSCLEHLPNLTVNDNLLFYLQRGQPVRINGSPVDGLVRLTTLSGRLLGIGEVLEDGRIGPRRLIRARS